MDTGLLLSGSDIQCTRSILVKVYKHTESIINVMMVLFLGPAQCLSRVWMDIVVNGPAIQGTDLFDSYWPWCTFTRSGQWALNNSLQLIHHLSAWSLMAMTMFALSFTRGKKSPCHQLYDFSLWTCLSSPQLACSQVLFYVDDIHKIISTSTSTGVNQICDRGRLKSNNSKITFPISKSFSLRFCNSVSNRNCLYALLCFQPLSTDLAPSAQV